MVEYSEKGIKFLTIINGGAAVSTLTFMGTKLGGESAASFSTPLIFYFLGLLFVGVIIAWELWSHSVFRDSYENDCKEYFKRDMSWEILNGIDKLRRETGWGTYICGILSLGCFCIGSYSLYCVISGNYCIC